MSIVNFQYGNPILKCGGYFFIGIGAILLLVSIYLGCTKIYFYSNSIEVDGVITSFEVSGMSESQIFYPVYKYTSLDEVIHEQKSSVGSSIKTFEIGEKVKIIYSQSDSQDAYINSLGQLWGFPLFIFLFSIVFMAFAKMFIKIQSCIPSKFFKFRNF